MSINIEEERAEREHQVKLRSILMKKQRDLEDKLAIFVDPNAAVTTIFNLEYTKFQLDRPKINVDLSPEDHLIVLDRTENWYTSRGYKYPYPERLKEQREHWEQRKIEPTNN